MSRRSGTPWTHELISGAIGSDLQGRCRLRRYQARKPKDRARDAGGALGMCGPCGTWAREERRGRGEGQTRAEDGASVRARSDMRAGPLRAREGGCGGCARTSGLDVANLAPSPIERT